jgi:hypothetical protein
MVVEVEVVEPQEPLLQLLVENLEHMSLVEVEQFQLREQTVVHYFVDMVVEVEQYLLQEVLVVLPVEVEVVEELQQQVVQEVEVKYGYILGK